MPSSSSGGGGGGGGITIVEHSASRDDDDNLPNNADNYEDLALIGTGAYGSVYRARDRTNNGLIVALKKVRIPLSEEGIPASTLREIAHLKQLESYEHPNVVRLLDVCQRRTRLQNEQQLILWLVFEHVEMDMSTYLERCPPPGLGPDRIKDLMFQILNGVDFLHSNRIVHRDLKPQNILVSQDGKVKLADFGLARIYDVNVVLTSVVVTLWYRSPEVLLHTSYTSSVDMWSCACIFAELFRRKPLFSGQSEGDQLGEIFKVIGTPVAAEWPNEVAIPHSSVRMCPKVPLQTVIPEICSLGCDLLQKMLTFNPLQRITAGAALSHDYFRDDGYVVAHPASYLRSQKGGGGRGRGRIATDNQPDK